MNCLPIQCEQGTIALRFSSDFDSVRPIWEELQETATCSYAQTFLWARAWAEHVLAQEGASVAIVLGQGSDGTPLFLWPFEVIRIAGLPVLRWLGQAHSNYNLGLFQPEVAGALTRRDMERLLRTVAGQIGVKAAVFQSQPVSWDGVENPFAKLPQQKARNDGYAVTLGDFGTLYHQRFGSKSRSQLARKERRLASFGPITYGWAEKRSERIAVLERFFEQKAKQFATQGIRNPFEARHKAFYRQVTLLEGNNPSRLRLGYLRAGDTIAATFNGTVGRKRFCVCLSSLAESNMHRDSPGMLLLRHQIEAACNWGLEIYDLGVGAAPHKERWYDRLQPLIDSFIPFGPQGHSVTLPLAGLNRLKRMIKTNPHLWRLAQTIRRQMPQRDAVD